MEALERHPSVEATRDGPGFDGWVDVPTSVEAHRPDVLLWYKPLEMEDYERVAVPRVITYNEAWAVRQSTAEIQGSGSRLVVFHHANDVPKYAHLPDDVRLTHIPHCVETSVFRDYGEEKIYDVLLGGRLTRRRYPLRRRLAKILRRRELRRYRIHVREHPGYDIDDVDQQVVDFARELNRAKLVVSCSSIDRYAFAKYVEVPACRSLHVADAPVDPEGFLRDTMVEIDPRDSSRKIAAVLERWINDDEMRERRTDAAFEKVRKERSQEHYADRFYRFVSSAI
jgi:hypothetical protein